MKPPFQNAPQRHNAFIQVPEIDAIIEFAKVHYRVDPKRIYLTGISAGSFQTWAYAAQHYAKLAAVLLLTLYPGVGHDSWGRTYDGSAGHDVYAWLLSHSL
ncbi:hypothetical protein [Corallococcus sp. AB011P]|uniref:hypothetical protein n=1 Tax=Corallococcus sp. AB011P TaxID=2316735 RepID=UPI0018F6DE58|nr:hypothetical protein [Corallococcus sp. AB011P]